MSKAFERLVSLKQEIALINNTASVLGWDQETHLPDKAIAYRAKQLAYLSGKAHELSTGDTYQAALEAAEQEGSDCPVTLANLRELRHQFDKNTKLPQELVERSSTTTSLAQAAWAGAREANSFEDFAPHLSAQLEIANEKAELWGYEDEPYDALVDNYERGAQTSDIVRIFDAFEGPLIETARRAIEKSQQSTARPLTGHFPIAQQQQLNREVAEAIGFDFTAGRIDTTTHPFCSTLGPEDVRLTTRYYEHDFTASLFGVMHEAGHGLYEQGLPTKDHGLPSGTSISLGIHESQSLLWEAHVGRSRGFWNHWLPRAQELFPQLRDWDVDSFLATINQAKYSFIRVDADEATYDLHILLRFNLERRLLRGELAVSDVPAAWDESFEKLFGMRPPSNKEGCLQDIHWSMGGIGYFPTYSLGNLNASQLFHQATQTADIRRAFDQADYKPLLNWMREHVHTKGSTLLPQDLMKAATGETTNPEYHLLHIQRRYL